MANLSRLSTVMVAEALDPDHPSHAYFIERQREIKETVASVIRGGIADGWVRDNIDPEIVATLISATMQGAQLQWFLDRIAPPSRKCSRPWQIFTFGHSLRTSPRNAGSNGAPLQAMLQHAPSLSAQSLGWLA